MLSSDETDQGIYFRNIDMISADIYSSIIHRGSEKRRRKLYENNRNEERIKRST